MSEYPFDADLGDYILRQVSAKAKKNITTRIVSVEIERTIEGASTLTIGLEDPNGDLMEDESVFVNPKARKDKNGRAKLNAIDLEVDDRWYRLQAVSPDNERVTLTFEDRSIVYLKAKNRTTKANRDSLTRAQFVRRLVRSVKANPIEFYSPDVSVRQPIRSAKDQIDEEARQDERKKGIPLTADLKVAGSTATREQLQQMERVLDVGTSYKISHRVMKAMVVAAIGESGFRAIPNGAGSPYAGVFQAHPDNIPMKDTEAQAYYFLHGGKGFQAGGAIQAAKDHKTWNAGTIAYKVEGSRANFPSDEAAAEHYNKWGEEAEAIIEEYGGASSGGTSTVEVDYEFRVEKGENYWQTIQRLADQVHWRAFIDYRRRKPTLVFMPEEGDGKEASLIRQKAAGVISRRSPRVINFSYDWDVGKAISEAEVEVICDRWHYRPGTVLELRDAGPANGKWLVASILRNLEDPFSRLTLKQPMNDLAEPAPELEQVESNRADLQNVGEGGGPWKLSKGANRSGAPLRAPVKEFLGFLANATNEEVVVTTGTNHSQYTTSGNVSDHWTGDAVDLGMGGDARTSKTVASKGDNIAIAALIVCGKSRKEATRILRSGGLNFSQDFSWTDEGGTKHRVQIGWRTDVGGNHWNHVHIGVSFSGTKTPSRRKNNNESTPDLRAPDQQG